MSKTPQSAPATFNAKGMKKLMRMRGITIQVMQRALRLNGVTTWTAQHLDGSRPPSGATVAVYAALLGIDPGLYQVRLRATIEDARRAIEEGPGVGRPKGSKNREVQK